MNKLKYVVAILFLASVSIFFLNVICLSGMGFSPFYFVKLALGKESSIAVLGVGLSVMREAVQNYSYIVFFLLMIILVECVLVALLPKKMPFYVAVVASVFNNIGLFFSFLVLHKALREVYGSGISLNKHPLYLWGIFYAVIVLVSIIVIARPGKARGKDQRILRRKKMNTVLDNAYKELGKAFYEGRFEEPLPELLPLFDKITRLREGNQNQQEQGVAKQPKRKFCTQCGAEIESGCKFCIMCGHKLG